MADTNKDQAKWTTLFDNNGVAWIWNGKFVWVSGTETGWSDEELSKAGYYCDTLDEAWQIINDTLIGGQ